MLCYMKWETVLNKWRSGKYPHLPPKIRKPFVWRTSRLDAQENNQFKQEFVPEPYLYENNHPDPTLFRKHLDSKKNEKQKHVISFKNVSGDTLLIVPKEGVGKNFSSLYYFMKEASATQQRMFWKRVALEARNQLKTHPFYISTEGKV